MTILLGIAVTIISEIIAEITFGLLYLSQEPMVFSQLQLASLYYLEYFLTV